MPRSQPTFFVQITSLFQRDPWHTVLVCHSRQLAESVSAELAVSEHDNAYGARAGLAGVRQSRVVTQTELRREGGWSAVERAYDEHSDLCAGTGDYVAECDLSYRLLARYETEAVSA